jgi:hypothetical protein
MTTSTLSVPTVAEKAVLDSGCTSHLIKNSTKCINKHPTNHGVRVGIANGKTMTATHNATLLLPHFPMPLNNRACQASVHPELTTSLVSLGQLCDNGCDYVLLDKHHASVIKNGVTSIIGVRDPSNGMWLADIEPAGSPMVLPTSPPPYTRYANSAYEIKTKVALIDFLQKPPFHVQYSPHRPHHHSNHCHDDAGLQRADRPNPFSVCQGCGNNGTDLF